MGGAPNDSQAGTPRSKTNPIPASYGRREPEADPQVGRARQGSLRTPRGGRAQLIADNSSSTLTSDMCWERRGGIIPKTALDQLLELAAGRA